MRMRLSEFAKIVAAVIVSLGGGGAIVAGLSNWLGKLWAARFMEAEKAHYQRELEALKADLSRASDRTGQTLREKLSLYKEAIPPVVDLITRYQLTPTDLSSEALDEFERKRLTTTALLGMFAALPVFEAYNDLVEYLYDCHDGTHAFAFHEFRVLAFKMLSEIRRDVGIEGDELAYRGSRE